MLPFNLAETFRRQAALQPEHPAILGPREGDCIGYSALQGEIETLAERFNMAGIDSGMNIGLHYPSGRDYIAFTYALWLCGACVTPIPMELADEEKQQIVHHIEMSAVISTLECGPFAAFAQGSAISLTGKACLLKLKTLREPPPGHPFLCRAHALRIDDTQPKWASLADFLAPRHSHHRLPHCH